MNPLARLARLLLEARMVLKIAMYTALFLKGAILPICPRLGPQIVERKIPQKRKIQNIPGILFIKMRKRTVQAQIKVPTRRGVLGPTLSLINPPQISPNTMPTTITANNKPIIDGETPMEVR